LRTALVNAAMICLAGSPALAQTPFVPPGLTPPDYVVTIVDKFPDGQKWSSTLMHHGDWTRVNPTQDPDRYTRYLSTNRITTISISANSILFSRESRRENDIDHEPRSTGERQTFLGESCTVWDVKRTRPSSSGWSMSQLSCVTDDGIQLWQKRIYGDDVKLWTEVTRLERRTVAADDVYPPHRLALDWWDQNEPAPATSDTPDYEVVMQLFEKSARTATSIRTRRRLGQWQFVDQILGARRSIEIAPRYTEVTQPPSHVLLLYASDDVGAPFRLNIMKTDPAPADPATSMPVRSDQPVDLNRPEVVLGETCRWFNMTLGIADAGRSACLTRDRVVLGEESYSRMDRTKWIAVRLARRAISRNEIRPPAELLDPQNWLIQ
jgi:hypothetical protein